MQKQEKWRTMIEPVIAGTPYELVGVECVGGGKHMVVRIFIDKPGGITIDDIAVVSRQISVIFDVEEPIKGLYTLEVSSPGLDRPLFSPTHFQQQIGRLISLKTRPMEANRHNFKGILRKAGSQDIEVDVDGQMMTFTYDDIEKAKVIYSELRQDHE